MSAIPLHPGTGLRDALREKWEMTGHQTRCPRCSFDVWLHADGEVEHPAVECSPEQAEQWLWRAARQMPRLCPERSSGYHAPCPTCDTYAAASRVLAREASTRDLPEEPHGGGRKVHVRRASEITMKRARFLWRGRIPLGVLVVLAGQGGIGKSTLTDSLAAQVTQGTLEGEHRGSPRNVLVCASEESWESMITPRLAAAGADLSKVLQLAVTEDDRPGSLSLPMDLEALEEAIRTYEVALVVLSPLVSQLGERIDAHVAKQVRSALDPIAGIAERTGATILGIVHPNKSGSTDPFSLIGLSGAFQDAARTVLLAVTDPDHPEAAVLGVSKTNMGRKGMLIGYRVETVELPVSDGTATVPRVLWGDERAGSVEDVLRALKRRGDGRSTKTDDAADWLWPYLLMRDGAELSETVLADGLAAGHSRDALRRARKARGIVTRRTDSTPALTVWVLPDKTRDGQTLGRGAPTSIAPIDPQSARGYDGPGRVVGPDSKGRWYVIDWS